MILKDLYNLGGNKFKVAMSNLFCILHIVPTYLLKENTSNLKLRKLVDFPDKEGKTRIIGI